MRRCGAAAALLSLVLLYDATFALAAACTQKPDPGPCRAFFRRYFYDHSTGSCEMFIYGGCAGSVPFRTAAECEAAQCGDEAAKKKKGREVNVDGNGSTVGELAVGESGAEADGGWWGRGLWVRRRGGVYESKEAGEKPSRTVVFSASTKVV